MGRLFDHPLQSRVGRRIALVVFISALVPLVLLGSTIFLRARWQMDAQERTRLHADTKTAALNGLERLAQLEQRLRWFVTESPRPAADGDLSAMLGTFDDLDTLALGSAAFGAPRLIRGHVVPPELSSEDTSWLHSGGALLVAGRETGHWLVAGSGDASKRWIAARLPATVVFGLDERAGLSPNTLLCVFDDGHDVVGCSRDEAVVRELRLGASLPSHGDAEASIGEIEYRVRTWALPLDGQYRAGVWTVALMEPRAEAYEALNRFARDVLLLSALSLVLVVLAVLIAIRRSLQPLSVLEDAARRVARREFTTEVHIATADEFEDLARGFNSMIAELRRRFGALEAFSVGTATSLARTIDAKSPWTAGHSERVTAMAVAIGRTMGLSAKQLDTLERGGLLHDIGKLATPPEVLEKAGPLTDEERRIMQQHPRDGVRILEPITTFTPLLPIVLQHHECFDGTGYPDGLAGERIDLLARVLAVADVYDALVSDRPYRAGWPLPKVIAHIQRAAGTHFDPRVVEAFTRLMASRATAGAAEDAGEGPERRAS